jgi:alkaline phosphatase D
MIGKQPTRRAVLAQAGAAALTFPTGLYAQEGQALSRIAFGSCARQGKDQPIWDAIAAAQPDLFVHLGDAVYADTENPRRMARAYRALAEKPEFQRFRAQTPMLAIWDDHDYGANDAGADYPMKEESRRQFCDFWGEPGDGPRRTQPGGIYTAQVFGPPGRRVQLILPDLRWNRQAGESSGGFLRQARQYLAGQVMRGRAIAGPYQTVDDASATAMLGAAQWAWLEAQFAMPADLRIVCSSLQVLSQGTGWEAWEQFPAERARLLALIGQARNVIFISGDVHYGEVSRLDRERAPPLWEVTSSGLTEVWAALPPNAHRVAAFRGRNFGMLEVDWTAGQVALRVHDEAGVVQLGAVAALQ